MTAIIEDRLLGWLAQCAAIGEPCPANARIGERFGVRGGAVPALFRSLERDGKITIAWHERPRGRVVTIVASGHRTAPPAYLSPRKDGR